ncbi:nidogen-like domain-containing protein, partial [Salmonella enterica subsp. enterica serovar Kentucky]|uniref:nidogen-like domain-containing protein n=1 Tax=Salmonella enterica TaxID=28901 RepID=UPI003F4BA515
FDPRNGGEIYYRQTNDSDQLHSFHNNFTLLLKDKDDFYPTHLFIATWYQVRASGCFHDKAREV